MASSKWHELFVADIATEDAGIGTVRPGVERSLSRRPFWIDAARICGDLDPGELELEADVVFGHGVVDGEDALVFR